MREQKQKKAVSAPLTFPDDDDVANNDNLVATRYLQFFNCGTSHEQAVALQHILRQQSDEPDDNFLPFIVRVYLAASSPHHASLRRMCYGVLRGLPPQEVSAALHARLFGLLEKKSGESSLDQSVSPAAYLEELLLLAVWQPHGLGALRLDQLRVLNRLADVLRHVRLLRQQGGSQERERGFHHASKVARCAAALAKANRSDPAQSGEAEQAVLLEISSGVKDLLVDESTTLSCRLACGISLPELLMAVAPRGPECNPSSVYSDYRSEFLETPLAHVCFISGMVNITAIDNDAGLGVFEELLTDLDRLGSRQELQQEPSFALTCVRTVLQWTEKLAEHISKISEDQKSFNLLEHRLEDLLRIAFLNIEHFVDAVQHQGKALFKVIVDLLVSRSDQKYIGFLNRTFEQLLMEPHHKKAKYVPLQTIAKHIQVSSIVKSEVVLEVYRSLREKSMLPYVDDFIRDVGAKHLAEDPRSWNSVWVDPFFAVFEEGRCSSTVEGLVPRLLRLRPSLAEEILLRSADQQVYLALALKAILPEQLLRRPDILQRAQWSTDESVRHSLLRLLTECSRSCEPIDPRVIPQLRLFLQLNISTQSQALRQAMFSSFKKLLRRVADSDVYWRKPGKVHEIYDENSVRDILRQQNELITWLWDFCLGELRPGCSFFTRSTALMLLELLAPLARGSDRWTLTKANTLLYWLKDTYESNKTAVLNILSTAPRHLLAFLQSEEDLQRWLQQALDLTKSARPPDGVTAVYILRLIAKASGELQNKKMAVESDTQRTFSTTISDCDCLLRLLRAVLPELRAQVDIAHNQGLLQASSSAPMYSALLCVRGLLNEAFSSRLKPTHVEAYRVILQEVLQLCYRISAVASPLVTHASPEGRLKHDDHLEIVDQFKAALNKGFGKKLDKADAIKTWAVAAQMLLLCCWRSHREVSLCFGDIAAHLEKITALQILAEDDFVKMGLYFMEELCRVRHRGAFEQASTGFSRLCASLWRSPNERLRGLPTKWLEELLVRIAVGEVSETRRSAGLPFIVQSVLVTEPEVNGGSALKRAMTGLLPLAAGKDEQARVHALNVLRVLYRNTRLGQDVMCYVGQGVCSALRGFTHPAWRVRNASTLLFSALLARIFGVNRSRQDFERKNCLTGNVFFQRFPELLPFLLEQITELVEEIRTHTGLYPILLLLGRLLPSLADSKLAAFMPLLDRCAASPLHGVRVATAKAYASLLPPEARLSALKQKLERVVRAEGRIGGNQLHGNLLQIHAVLTMAGNSPELVELLSNTLPEGGWIASSPYALGSAEYIRLLIACRVQLKEVLEMTVRTNKIVAGGDQLESALTRYKLMFGTPACEHTDSEKAAALEFHLEQSSPSPPSLMYRVLEKPDEEHPDVQQLAYEVATKFAHELDDPERRVDQLLERLGDVTQPSIAVALFGLIAALVPRLQAVSLPRCIEALLRYSAPNQDPDLRQIAALLAYNILSTHGRLAFTSCGSSVQLELTKALVNLVLDNDVHVRNRIVDGLATITTDGLSSMTPLDAMLALCAETCTEPREFARLLIELAAADGDDDMAGADAEQKDNDGGDCEAMTRNDANDGDDAEENDRGAADEDGNDLTADSELDEQPFEKSELNTFYDSLVLAESCRRAVERLRPRLGGCPVSGEHLASRDGGATSLDEIDTKKIRQATDCELACNRQLEASLVVLGQRLTIRAMIEGRLQVCEEPLVNNEYFARFAASAKS